MTQEFGPAAERLAGAAAMLLGWRPDEFWAATPRELATALTGGDEAPGEPPSRDMIDALMARFPDERAV